MSSIKNLLKIIFLVTIIVQTNLSVTFYFWKKTQPEKITQIEECTNYFCYEKPQMPILEEIKN